MFLTDVRTGRVKINVFLGVAGVRFTPLIKAQAASSKIREERKKSDTFHLITINFLVRRGVAQSKHRPRLHRFQKPTSRRGADRQVPPPGAPMHLSARANPPQQD